MNNKKAKEIFEQAIENFRKNLAKVRYEEEIEDFKSWVKEAFSESSLNKQEGGNHYKDLTIQPVEFIEKNKLSFCEGNIIKYVCRHRRKGGIEDLRKAKHYLEILAEVEYGESL
jgi:hypothetical protein